MKATFAEQAEALFDGGVDLFIVETCQDVLQIKAALNGIEEGVCQKRRTASPDGVCDNGNYGGQCW